MGYIWVETELSCGKRCRQSVLYFPVGASEGEGARSGLSCLFLYGNEKQSEVAPSKTH